MLEEGVRCPFVIPPHLRGCEKTNGVPNKDGTWACEVCGLKRGKGYKIMRVVSITKPLIRPAKPFVYPPLTAEEVEKIGKRLRVNRN